VSEPPAQLLVPDVAPHRQGEAGLGEVQENLREGAQDALPALLESPDLGEAYKAELRRRAALFNPVTLKREMDEARERLLKLAAQRGITGETA
jgi:hypothetical protein